MAIRIIMNLFIQFVSPFYGWITNNPSNEGRNKKTTSIYLPYQLRQINSVKNVCLNFAFKTYIVCSVVFGRASKKEQIMIEPARLPNFRFLLLYHLTQNNVHN